MAFKTPTLLITFNRPEHTRKVLEEVKKQQPEKLFVFQDGAREGNVKDAEKCKAVQETIKKLVDWNCELHTNFSEKNLGCGKGPATAITWFFENVEEGIILEDDCLPHPDFFEFCEILLEKYRHNPKISFIGGSSFQKSSKKYPYSYYFGSGSYGTCGWATWKRVWRNFDYYLQTIDKKLMYQLIRQYFKEPRQKEYWREIFYHVKNDRFNDTCWDYQFYFSVWKNDMLAIIPYYNLITNIGYDESGTHTTSDKHPAANIETKSIFPLVHPKSIKLNVCADFYVHKNFTLPYEYGWSGAKRVFFRLNKRVKRITNHHGSWLKNKT